jgi:hypothetical protein
MNTHTHGADGGSSVTSPEGENAAVTGGALEVGDTEHGTTFWIAFALGSVAIIIGVFGILDHGSQANPFKVFRILVGLNIVNDAVVVPLVLGLALAVRRWAPRWVLAPTQIWLIIAGSVSLYAYPLVGDFGRKPSQPSELPFNYAHNLLIVIGCITVFCAALAIRAWRHEHRAEPLAEPQGDH